MNISNAARGAIAAPLDIWFNAAMAKDKDWLEWHRHYDNPNSSISLRLAIVQSDLRRALAEAPRGEDGTIHLISMCAGEGRDVLPVLAEEDGGRGVKAVLVEFDETMSQRARATAADLGLSGVEVKTADAGTTDTYRDLPPAHIMLVCSVLGNVTAADMRRTVATLPSLMADDGIVIWTRSDRDRSQEVRRTFLDQGFAEMSFTNTADDKFWVGMNRVAGGAADLRPPQPGTRMFSFT
jgi:hypothetical protein